ncbi:MAG TPA: tyrosine-type recombinase/integrase [Rubricoccaceae bacterium]|jgi:site-specific recombinase XerD
MSRYPDARLVSPDDPSPEQPTEAVRREAVLYEPVPSFGFTEASDLVPVFLLRFDRPNTRRAYARDLATFFGSEYVTLPMARAVSFPHVNAYLESLESDGKSVATLRRHVATLRGFFAWLVALGFLSLNPADRHLVRRIAPDRARDRVFTVLTREQARRLIDSIDLTRPTGLRDRTLILTLLNCVLRRSEAAAMNVEHLRPAGEYWVLDLPATKGGSNQTVKVPVHVADAIRTYSDNQGIRAGALWRSHSRNGTAGARLSASGIYTVVARSAITAGISDVVGAHTLRHTGCTLAIEAGATIQQVQTHARHKNIETTMVYVHQRDRLANSAADFIDL